MANETNSQQPTTENQIVGRVKIVNGIVQAQAPGDAIRDLVQDSQIYANDRIMTGEEGSISILFLDPGQTQLDIGRMSDMTISEDVFQVGFPTDLEEATADVEQIQEALLAGEFDPTTDLEATAAGPAAGGGERGGGRTLVRFDAEGREVTPESGAETEGIGYSFAETNPSPIEELQIAPLALATPTIRGTTDPIPPTLEIDRVVEEEAMIMEGGRKGGSSYKSEYFSTIQEISGEDGTSIDYWHFTVDSDENSSDGGYNYVKMNFQSEGSWPYPDLDSDHADGSADQSELRPDVHIYEDDGSGGLGDHVRSWISPLDPYIGIPLEEGQAYVMVVGDFPFTPPEAEGGINVDPDPILPTEHGPYTFTITGNVTITQTPENGYITSKPALSDGNPDQEDPIDDSFQPDSAVVSGNLGDGTWSIIPSSLAALPILSSQGYAITYELNNDTPGVSIIEAWVRFGNDDETETVQAKHDNPNDGLDDRLVFTLQVEPDGDYEFSLLDQLDNVAPGLVDPDGVIREAPDPEDPNALDPTENTEMILLDGEGNEIGWINNLDFSGSLRVTFPDGHPSEGTWTFPDGSFTITPVDDIPVAVNGCEAQIRILVKESGMNSDIHDEGYNDNADQSDGIPGWDNSSDEDGGHRASIAQLFKVGADEFDGRQEAVYSITSDSNLLNNLQTQQTLYSHGEKVQYHVEYEYVDDLLVSSELIAYVGVWPEDDSSDIEEPTTLFTDEVSQSDSDYPDEVRIVFTLEVKQNGDWKFDLDDQLDHVDNTGAKQNYSLRSGDAWEGEGASSISGLDLSAILTITDFDGDMLTGAQDGAFILYVQDDIPKLVCKGSVTGMVEESALSTIPPFTWEYPADSSDGNSDRLFDAFDDVASESHHSNGSLTQLVQDGADEEVIFKLSGDTSQLDSLLSKGEPLFYTANSENGTLVATAGQGGPVVFTLKVEENGDWSFDLDDQLDHVDDPNDGQNFNLRTSPQDQVGVSSIDLSSLIIIQDFDGDEISLSDGMFTMRVEDDIPVLTCKTISGFVEEDGMSIMHGDPDDNSEGNPGPRTRDDRRDTDSDDEDEGHGSGWHGQSLATLVSEGADEDITFSFSQGAIGYMMDQALTSQNRPLEYTIDGNDLIAKAGGDTVFTLHVSDNGDWTFDLDDQLDHKLGSGENTQLQSGEGHTNYINFSGAVVAVDYDGDETALKSTQFTMTVQDDVPITDPDANPISVDVEEAALSEGKSQSGHEKPVDSSEGTDTKNHNHDDTDSSGASGSLTSVIKDGADENVTFSLWNVNEGSLPTLYSKGEEVEYDVTHGTGVDTLVATADGNTVFTLNVFEDGTWKFDLDDQLDHRDDKSNSRNTELRTDVDGDTYIPYIDLSSMIKVEDFDGDIITLGSDMFTLTVTDDIPVLTCHRIQGSVEEDGMSFADEHGDGPEDFDNSEGNHNWWERHREGPNDDEDDGSGTGYRGESLHTLVQDGADEEVTFEFADYEDVVKPFMEAQGLTSKGISLEYEVQGSAMRAYTTQVDGGELTVFTLVINDETGDWYFDLDDQLDHNYWEHNGITGGYGENTYLQSNPPEDGTDAVSSISRIDLSGAILAVDKDGDEVQLRDGQFTMKVEDDVPVLCPPKGLSVREANLENGSSPPELATTGSSPAVLATILSGNFIDDGNIRVGADEPPTIAIFDHGEWHTITLDGSSAENLVVGGSVHVQGESSPQVGQLTIDSDGNWTYELQENTLSHPDNIIDSPLENPPDGDRELADQVTDHFDVWVRDYDYDWAHMNLNVNILDDGPTISISEVAALETEFVMEDALGNITNNVGNNMDLDNNNPDPISPPEQGNLDDPPAATSEETDSATFHLNSIIAQADIEFGADGEGSISNYSITGLDAPHLSAHQSAQQQIWYFQNGNTIEARTTAIDNSPDETGDLIFTFSVNADTGVANFNLNDQMDHGPAAGDEGTLNIEDLGQFVQYTISDGDGDKASVNFDGFIKVNVENDVPEAISPDNVPANLNLVLMLDTSYSMSSKVDPLDQNSNTRAFALQEAVQGLLVSLESTASAENIRVHIVTYGSDSSDGQTFDLVSSDPSITTKTAAEVMSEINLTPSGNTNYEAAFQSTLNWTGSAVGQSPLTMDGVTNQVIFISDGDPTAYVEGGTIVFTGDHEKALNEVIAHDSDDPAPGVLGYNGELEELNAWADSINAVGIQLTDSTSMDRLDDLDSTANGAENIQSAAALQAILPTLVGSYVPIINVEIEEDDLLVDGGDQAGDLQPTPPLPVADDYNDDTDGNIEDGDISSNKDQATGTNLSDMFKVGADEELTFTLDTSANLPDLYSGGQKLNYTYTNNGTMLVAYTAGTDTLPANIIFTFTVQESGLWNFDLDGQLDHVNDGNSEENYDLISGDEMDEEISGIDLSALIIATDEDGDSVPASAGAFIVTIQDDVPTAMDDTGSMFGYSSYEDTVDDAPAATFDVLANDVAGADKSLKLVSLEEDPNAITVDGGGTASVVDNKIVFDPGTEFSGQSIVTYTVVDGDGDTSTASLTITERYLKVGTNADDTGDTENTTIEYQVGDGTGTIIGGAASDILIGDVGGTSTTITAGDVNLLFILDISGSMSGSQIALLRQSVENVFTDINGGNLLEDAQNVRVNIVAFDDQSTSLGTFDIKGSGDGSVGNFTAALLAVNGLVTDYGSTNYEAGMLKGIEWTELSESSGGPLESQDVANQVLFLTDGEPNTWNGDPASHHVSDYTDEAMDQIFGTASHIGRRGVTVIDDDTNEVIALHTWSDGNLRAVGLGITDGSEADANLDLIDSNGDTINVTNSTQLEYSIVQAITETDKHLASVGDDTIEGGDGNDLIYGDSLFTDDVFDTINLLDEDGNAVVASDYGIEDGSGWATFEALENDATIEWTRSDTIDYILEHPGELAEESLLDDEGRLGGEDTLSGQDGNDVIFGQESSDVALLADIETLGEFIDAGDGDDWVDGGSGSDYILGGTGNDTLIGGDGSDAILGGAGDDILVSDNVTFDSIGTAEVTDDSVTDYVDGGSEVDTSNIAGIGVETVMPNDDIDVLIPPPDVDVV